MRKFLVATTAYSARFFSSDDCVAMAFVAPSTGLASSSLSSPATPPRKRGSWSCLVGRRRMLPKRLRRRERIASSSPPIPPCPHVVLSSSTYAYDNDMGYSSAVINVDESAPRDVSSFENWAYEIAGIQTSPGFALNNDDGMNLDVYACTTSDVPAGSCVLYVPENWILTSDKAMAELRTRDMDQAEKVRECRYNAHPRLATPHPAVYYFANDYIHIIFGVVPLHSRQSLVFITPCSNDTQ